MPDLAARRRVKAYIAEVAGVRPALLTEATVRRMAEMETYHPTRRRRGAILLASRLFGYVEDVPDVYIEEMYRQGYIDERAYHLYHGLWVT